MKLHDLTPNPGSKKNRKRVGRGISAGQGKTAGRGTKGAGARSGEEGHCIVRAVTCLSSVACRLCAVKVSRRLSRLLLTK